MDYPLGAVPATYWRNNYLDRLNPYSNGLPSRGHFVNGDWGALFGVLIPILMDYPLGDPGIVVAAFQNLGLNPYSNGLPSRGGIYNRLSINIGLS